VVLLYSYQKKDISTMKILISLITLGTLLCAEIKLPQNFKSDFEQTITNEKGKVIHYSGDVLFIDATQSLFKWSYTSPTQKEVCTDGIQLVVVDHDLEQISTYLINNSIDLKEILKRATKISNQAYTATYKEIEYLINLDKEEQLEQISYVDDLDNRVKIIFKNMNYSTTISEDVLECVAPQEYDVIKG